MAEQANTYALIQRRALHAFEHPPAPPEYDRPSDIFVTMQPSMDNWDAMHIWFDTEQRTGLVRRIFWRHLFDRQRLKDAFMGSKYGREANPSLLTSDYVPSYEELQRYISRLLGAIPGEIPPDEAELERATLGLCLRLPLGELTLLWDSGQSEEWWALTQLCHEFHDWVLTATMLKRGRDSLTLQKRRGF